jgi:hypothetical protein
MKQRTTLHIFSKPPLLKYFSSPSCYHCYHYSVLIPINIVTRLRVGRPGFDFRQGQGFLYFPMHTDQFWEPPSPILNGKGGPFRELKRPGREVYHSPPMPRLRLRGPYSPSVNMARCLIERRDNFGFNFHKYLFFKHNTFYERLKSRTEYLNKHFIRAKVMLVQYEQKRFLNLVKDSETIGS